MFTAIALWLRNSRVGQIIVAIITLRIVVGIVERLIRADERRETINEIKDQTDERIQKAREASWRRVV